MKQEEYDLLPGTGAASLLNGTGEDGQPVLKYAKSEFKDGRKSLTHYWNDKEGKRWRMAIEFIPGENHLDKFNKLIQNK